MPEINLVASVIAQAFRDLHATGHSTTGHAYSIATHASMAAAWIDSTETEDWSFIWCCDQLGLDPDVLRVAGKRRFVWARSDPRPATRSRPASLAQ